MEQKTIKYSEVLSSNINAVRSLAATIRGTVGPKGLDVMLVDEFGNYTCTNDGVEILSNMQISHPAAKLTVEVAKSQEQKIGDGTTTAVILCDSLLASASLRINSGTRPARLAKGIQVGIEKVIKELKDDAKPISGLDDPKLRAITGIAARAQDDITDLIIEAAKRISQNNPSKNPLLETMEKFDLAKSIIATTGLESAVIDGLFIKKKTHFNYTANFENTPTLLIDGPFEPEPMSSEAVSTDEGVKRFEHNIQSLLESAKKITKSGVKAIFTSSSMLPTVEEYFAKEGVFVLTHITKNDIRKLSKITGAKLITRTRLLNSDTASLLSRSGTLTKIENRDDLGGFTFLGAQSYQASILISAETETVVNERKLIAQDAARALCAALRSGYVVGEGVAEMNIAESVEKYREEFEDKCISTGIEIVVEALKALFHQITENAGFNHNDIYYKFTPGPENTMGINLENGDAVDLEEAGVLDPVEVKTSAFKIAGEIATQILRINMLVQAQ